MEASFSIVVPVHGRSRMLAELLESVQKASIASPEIEVESIIVDSSGGIEAAEIQQLCQQQGVAYLRSSNIVTMKRNIGIQHASGDYILFTDSDCELLPNTLTEHILAHTKSADDVAGVLGLTIVSGKLAPIWQTLNMDPSFTAAFSFANWLTYAPWGTCTNLSFRKQILSQIGGFDETWPLVVYGEDVDLGLRVTQAGYRIRCHDQAVVKHNSSNVSSLQTVLRKKYYTGVADYHLGHKHPDRLTHEFPGWTAATILLFPVVLARVLINRSPWPLIWLGAWLFAGILTQAIIAARQKQTKGRSLIHHLAVILFEAAFDIGQIVAAGLHGKPRRLWTKFVYIDLQLIGEREKRIRQMWGVFIAFLIILALC